MREEFFIVKEQIFFASGTKEFYVCHQGIS